MKNASPGPVSQEDRAALEGLLGPAEELAADLLLWTSTRAPDGDGARAGLPYDPDRHEAVYYHHDVASGLRALVSLHSTVLGPGLGGARWRPYEHIGEALIDVLRLSAAMTAKSAVAGVDYGGGKAAIVGDPAAKTPELLAAYGRFVERLGGRYITTTDVGTTLDDLRAIARETDHLAGVARGGQHDVDTSEPTARTVINGMHAACEFAFGNSLLVGRRVVVVGTGKVGGKVARRAAAAGAHVAVTDLYEDVAADLAREIGGEQIALDDAYLQPCDVLSPNALGGVLNPQSITQLRCRVVCGAANNQLLHDPADAELLAARGILYAPDYVVSSGGVIAAGIDHAGGGADRIEELVKRAGPTTLKLLHLAEREGITTAEAALRSVDARLANARAA
ncbi:MAG: Glu/Leu/Phe/Val dehydrogenase [Chloroflexi bacterium]|nr:Glu/Leu/Phe/Val dehydrogenase [Chloroflexota bacterium]